MSDEAARAINRAAFVDAALEYLPAERRQHAELLGDVMTAAIDAICAVANVNIEASGERDVQQQLEQLGPQIQAHAERIAHAAAIVLSNVYQKTLLVASSVPIEDDASRLN